MGLACNSNLRAPAGQIGVETAQPMVVEKSHISSLASGADRFERNMRHLAGQYSMKGPLDTQQPEDATVEPIPESPAQGTPTADAAAEGSSPTQRSSYSPLAMLGAAGAGIAAVGTAAASVVKSTLSPAKPDAAQQQGQPEPRQEPQQDAAVPITSAAGPLDTPAADTEAQDTTQSGLADMPKDTPQLPQPTPQVRSFLQMQVSLSCKNQTDSCMFLIGRPAPSFRTAYHLPHCNQRCRARIQLLWVTLGQ
jgi:hypothetical protein